MKNNRIIDDFRVDDQGKLHVLTAAPGEKLDWGELDLYRRDADFLLGAEQKIWPYVKLYSFADSLKSLLIDVFGLEDSSVYGNEKERAEPTHLYWENMPGVVTPKQVEGFTSEWVMAKKEKGGGPFAYLTKNKKNKGYYDSVFGDLFICHEPGQMSGREVMQFFGTEIGRKIYNNIWVNATLNKIKQEGSQLAIITDARFPNEVQSVKKEGGHVIRLEKRVDNDQHRSEIALDGYEGGYTVVLKNQGQALEQTLKDLDYNLDILGVA